MIERTEYEKWEAAEYPYDEAKCGACATLHDSSSICIWPEHEKMREEAVKLGLNHLNDKNSPKFRETVLAFRKKYARFYANAG